MSIKIHKTCKICGKQWIAWKIVVKDMEDLEKNCTCRYCEFRNHRKPAFDSIFWHVPLDTWSSTAERVISKFDITKELRKKAKV